MSFPLQGRKVGVGGGGGKRLATLPCPGRKLAEGASFRRSLLEGDRDFGIAARRGGIDRGDNTVNVQP
jgi:hypothetical protein